jgi:hypothetical protein
MIEAPIEQPSDERGVSLVALSTLRHRAKALSLYRLRVLAQTEEQ